MCVLFAWVGCFSLFFNVQIFVTLCCIMCKYDYVFVLALDVSWSESCNSLYYRKLYSSKSLEGIGTTMSGVAMCCPILTIRKEVASVHTDGRGGGVIHSFSRYLCSGNSGEQQFILDAQQRWQQLGQRGGWWWVCRCSFQSLFACIRYPIRVVFLYDVYVLVFGCFWSRNFLAFFVTAILVSA